jgi:hypothetical protein
MRLTLAIAALTMVFNLAAAQKNEKIEGNGKVVTRDIAVRSFDGLKASGIYELKLSQGDKESVRIEADENLQDYFSVSNNGSTLVIDMDKLKNKNLNGRNTLRVFVTFKNLKELDLKMVGNTASEKNLSFSDLKIQNKSVGNLDLKLTANKLSMENKSVGNVTLAGKAENAVFENQGVGSLRAGELVVQTIDIENEGVGSAEVNAVKELKVKESRISKVTNRGAAQAKKSGKTVIK